MFSLVRSRSAELWKGTGARKENRHALLRLLPRRQIDAYGPASRARRGRGITLEHERVVARNHAVLGAREPLERVVTLEHVALVVEHAEHAPRVDMRVKMGGIGR